MKTSAYFKRTLSYDSSPAASEYYERCADQVFDSDPSKTRIGALYQTHGNTLGHSEAKDTVSKGADKDHQETSKNELLDSSSDDHDDRSSILSVASSTALPTAMDQRQADSAPPLYPGIPKLISREIKEDELEAFVEETKHDFRVFYLRHQTHSLSQLRITKSGFELMARLCHVFPRFNEYVTGFGKKSDETEVGPPPLKFRNLYTNRGNVYRGFECTYILRYIEFTNRGRFKDPWSLRQFGVYHRFKGGDTPCSTWILVGASQRTEGRLDQYTRSVDDIVGANPFELHVIFLDTVIGSWRPYLVDKAKQVTALSNKANGVVVSTEDDPDNFVEISPDDHLELKQIEDETADLLLCLDSTSGTLASFEEMYDQFCQRQDYLRPGCKLDDVAVALRAQVKEIQYTERKAEALLAKIKSTRTLTSSLLERQSGFNINHQIGALRAGNSIMQNIAEKNCKDSSSMRILTIITMIYLPCTIVCNFYSTQFVDQTVADDGSSQMGYAQNVWVFFAISIPLTIFTFIAWYSWIRIGDMRKERAIRLSEKEAESQV
ncbi:uncharacterized protein M421DRAFT_230472 [Didymella exigua CBS 183.55]|uniref:CorA-like transporter domain-containing protein n=1 Tax=Didymella exigua CBS 183.55 TaxID=1150837 RepID=A0A6A5RFY8_9PLEO|nr:uncharacterized protein M421DRAFT_230472 [Didymella exigua CBS 183.55]KAF1926014.1 hypothetical protein M421DRAFT_230472 [Didymella exigua CBS 183.55]